ncbi:MAG: tetratricopeptide repeat-containing sensor histidine kinase [Bacteroidia bacterium]
MAPACQHPADTQQVNLHALLGGIYHTDSFTASMHHYGSAIRIADSIGFKKGAADGRAGMAELQNSLGILEESMRNALAALDLYANVRDSAGIGRSLVSIGLVQTQLKQFDKALQSLRQARKAYLAAGSRRGELTALHNMAVIYTQQGDTTGARKQYLENLQRAIGTEYWVVLAATYNNLGNLMNFKTEGDSALAYFEKALEYKRKRPNNASIGNTMLNITRVYLERGEFDKAEAKLKEAEALILESAVKERIIDYHKIAGELYLAKGDYRASALHFQQQAVIQDSLYEPQMTEQAARLEAAYDAKSQKREIELLSQASTLKDEEKARLRWITGSITAGLAVSLTILVILLSRGRQRAKMLSILSQKNTEIKRQQQEIVLQNQALSLQNLRLESVNREKDGLIGIVAHDLRAPLNRSAALAELVASLGPMTPEQERFLNMIKKVSEDGARLIQDILELNAYENQQLRVELGRANLSDLVEMSVHAFSRQAAEKDITIEWEQRTVWGRTDEKLLARIMDNLLSNAVKFTPKGRQVRLSISSDAERHWISIKDQGPGFSDQDKAGMFQKFQRLSARPTGGESSTGLGLSIVQTLAQRIQATIQVESEFGKGTTFKIGIPRVD